MWTSERRLERRAEESAALGQVTLGGDPAGVFLGGERRWLPVYSPGPAQATGYWWCRPETAENPAALPDADRRRRNWNPEKSVSPEEPAESGYTAAARI